MFGLFCWFINLALCWNLIAKTVPINKPTQVNDTKSNTNIVKQNKPTQNSSAGNNRYVPQKAENVQYYSRVDEDSSAKIPACLNRQSSTLIYSSDSGDLGKFKNIILFNLGHWF